MSRVIGTRGLPGSGKTTWAKRWVEEDPTRRVRVNRDDLRFQMYGEYWGDKIDEAKVSEASDILTEVALAAGLDVIHDNTHLKDDAVESLRRFNLEFGADIEMIDFPIDLDEAIERDRARIAAGDRGVGADVITSLHAEHTINGDFRPLPAEFTHQPAPRPVTTPALAADQGRLHNGTFTFKTQPQIDDAARPVNAAAAERADVRARREDIIGQVTDRLADSGNPAWDGEIELLNAAIDDPILLPNTIDDVTGYMLADSSRDWSLDVALLNQLR